MRSAQNVSVSTNGSRRLQRSQTLALEPTADWFQYPLTDRGDCNKNSATLSIFSSSFQYPLTDRGDCNNPDQIFQINPTLCFSIH